MAAPAGLEPADEGVKVPCLTTWLRRCGNRRLPAAVPGRERKVRKEGKWTRGQNAPGLSDRTRTDDPVVPGHVRCQLRYTQIKKELPKWQSLDLCEDGDIGFKL